MHLAVSLWLGLLTFSNVATSLALMLTKRHNGDVGTLKAGVGKGVAKVTMVGEGRRTGIAVATNVGNGNSV